MLELFRDPVARVVWIAALLLRLSFGLEVWANDLDLTKNDQLDMVFLHENSRAIAAGDLRLEHPVLGHYSDIREKIYGPERYDRLFGPHTYIDSPGYLYFAAVFEKLSGGSPYAIIFAQLVLDALGCALVYALARRVYGLAEARVALVAAALCLECVAEAGFVLRESVIAFLTTWCVFTLDGARRSGSPRWWALAGLAWGLGWTTKLTFSLLLPFVPFMTGRSPRRLGAFAAGALVAVAPFAVRNVSLGVPPLRMSATSLQILAHRNMKGYEGAAEWVGQHAAIRRVLDASNETSTGVLMAAIESHERGGYLRQLGRKLFYFFAGVDFFNNIRVSFLRLLSPVLALCVVWWGVLSPWALIGFVRGVRRKEALPLVAAFLTLGIGAALLGGVYTRYRMVVEPIACVFFAATVTDAARRIRHSGIGGTGPTIVLLAVILRVGSEHLLPYGPMRPLTRQELAGYVVRTWPSAKARAYLLNRVERSGAP